jgi:hypothetical protein
MILQQQDDVCKIGKLHKEWCSARWLGPKHRKTLENRFGVSRYAWHHSAAAAIGVKRIQIHEGLYEPAEDGFEAVVIATNILKGGQIEDLIAFRPSEPDKWWLRLGIARWLGEWDLGTRLVTRSASIEQPILARQTTWTDEPLHIYRNPLEWLRASCDGAVPLCREACGDLVNVQAALTFDSHHHRGVVEEMIQQPISKPQMLVRMQTETIA